MPVTFFSQATSEDRHIGDATAEVHIEDVGRTVHIYISSPTR
jgi:hypothetical protein